MQLSTTPDPGRHVEKWQTQENKHHILRAKRSALYLQVATKHDDVTMTKMTNTNYTKGLWKRITQIKSFISQTLRMSVR